MCVLIEWHTLCLLINHKKTDLGVLPQRVLDCYLYNTTVLHPIGLAATKVITQLESNIKTQQIERTNAVTLHKYLKTYVIVKMLMHIDFVSGGNSNYLSIELHITNHWLFSTWVFDPHCDSIVFENTSPAANISALYKKNLLFTWQEIYTSSRKGSRYVFNSLRFWIHFLYIVLLQRKTKEWKLIIHLKPNHLLLLLVWCKLQLALHAAQLAATGG